MKFSTIKPSILTLPPLEALAIIEETRRLRFIVPEKSRTRVKTARVKTARVKTAKARNKKGKEIKKNTIFDLSDADIENLSQEQLLAILAKLDLTRPN